MQSRVTSIHSQAHTLTKAWTERIDNAKDAKMINQDVMMMMTHLKAKTDAEGNGKTLPPPAAELKVLG